MTKQKTPRKLAIAVMVAGIGSINAVPQKSYAQICPCLPLAYATTIATSTGAISAGFGMLTLMIQQSFSALNSALSAQSSTIAETSTYATQQYANTMRQQLAFEQQKKAQNTVDSCVPKAASARAANIASNASANEKAVEASIHNYTRNMATCTSKSAGANAICMTAALTDLYCDDLEETLGLCKAVGEPLLASANVGSSQKFNPRGAHVMAGTLFGTNSLTKERRDAAVVFAKNVMGLPPAKPGNNDLRTAEGVAKFVERNTNDARKSTTNEVFSYLTGQRAELEDPEMKKWADAILKNITGQSDAKNAGANPETKGISMQELMAISAEHRFKDAGWLDQVMAATGEATPLLKQITLMEATMLHNDWKSFELEQRIAANIASSLAAKAEGAYPYNN